MVSTARALNDNVTEESGYHLARQRLSLWGIAPSSPLHMATDHLILPQLALRDQGYQHTVLLADDQIRQTQNLSDTEIEARVDYYRYVLKSFYGLQCNFVRSSELQQDRDYRRLHQSFNQVVTTAQIRASLPASVRRHYREGSVSLAQLNALTCQQADVLYFQPDLVIADSGQQKIYSPLVSVMETSPEAWDKACLPCLSAQFRYVELGHDILGRSLSESVSGTRITLHETRASLDAKIYKMYAPPAGQPMIEGRTNALLEHFEYSVFPWRDSPVSLLDENQTVQDFASFERFETAYQAGLLHPHQCKEALVNALWERIERAQQLLGRALTSWIDTERCIGLSSSDFTEQRLRTSAGEAGLEVSVSQGVPLLDVLALCQPSQSRSALRRLAEQGAVRLNDDKVVFDTSFAYKNGDILKIGRNTCYRLITG